MLTSEEVVRFHEAGFLAFERLIDGDRLATYRAAFDRLVERGRALEKGEGHWSLELDASETEIAGLLHKVQGVCVVEPKALELASEPAIVDRVEALLETSDIDVFGTKFFPKLPGGGTSTHWHQDNYYFGTNSARVLSCGIYLEDTDVENGCLCVVPGSHREGMIREHARDPRTHGSWTQVDESTAVDLEVPGGTVVLFSANILHGARDNVSDRSRYSTAWHYVPGDLALERFPRGEYKDRHTVRGS